MSESEYIIREIENHTEPGYPSDLRILRRFVQNGSFGYRASDDVVFQRLKTRYPEAYGAFGEERRREVLDKYERSPYIEEQTRAYPNNPAKDGYLEALMRLRHHTIMFKIGYVDRIGAMGFTTLKNRYPEAHESFEQELSALAVHS
jgi:hypothetical protein